MCRHIVLILMPMKRDNMIVMFYLIMSNTRLNSKKLSHYLGVSPRTISRYIFEINLVLADRFIQAQIKYSREMGAYIIE